MSTTTTGPPSATPPSTPTSTSVTTPTTPLSIPPTTPPTTSATSSTPSSSSSTGASSSSTSNTSSSSTSSSAVSSATSTVSTTPAASKPSITTASSNIPAVVTEVSTTFVSQSQSGTPTAVGSNNTSNSFFTNKGAVAGVFSVVGLIGLVIIIALIINCVRRRQARKFDKELFLATQEAAATAPNPNFLDDEDDEPKRTGYSDVSHGTYGQPPMEAFNMRDMGGHSTAVGEIYDPYPNGGAAGIGVARARSVGVNPNASRVNSPANLAFNPYAAALQEGGSPYPQFAMGPRDTYGTAGPGGPFGRGNMELGATVIPSGQQQPYSQRSPPPQEYNSLGRSKSNSTAATHLSTPSQSQNYSQPQPSYPVRQMSPPRTTPTPGLPNPYTPQVHPAHEVELSGGSADDAAYGGYIVDDVEEEVPKRVLKIANES